MKILDRYVFIEWLKFFVIAIAVTLGVITLNDMFSNLKDLFGGDASLQKILTYYMYKVVTFVPLVLPISFLLSLIYILGSLHRNNEITAMRAAGMNIFKITRSLWFAGLLLSFLTLWLNATLVQTCTESARQIIDEVKFAQEIQNAKNRGESKSVQEIADSMNKEKVIKPVYFYNRERGRLWFIDSFATKSNTATGVSILIFKNGVESSRISAQTGVYDAAKKHWLFYNCREITLDPKSRNILTSKKIKEIVGNSFNEDPEIMILSTRNVKDLSLHESRALIDALGVNSPAARKYQMRAYSIWSSPFACLIVVAIAIPFSVAGVRTNPMVGVSKTAALFFFYYVMDGVFTSLGNDGSVSALAAVIIPNAVVFIFALSLYRKAI